MLADGWYEWLRPESGELVHSALILTTRANGVCAPVHDRMPVVLAGPDEEAAWLAGDDDPNLLGPLAEARTGAFPANPAVNRAGVEGPHLIEVPMQHADTDMPQLSLET